MAMVEQDLASRAWAAAVSAPRSITTYGLGLWVAAGGWASLAAVWVTGSTDVFGHEQTGTPASLAMVVFLIGWSAMVAAMMLPSSLPTLRRVDATRTSDGNPTAPPFMAGYFVAWGAFGAAAFAADRIVHVAAASTPWLAQRPSLIIAAAAMAAGGAELLGRAPPPLVPRMPPEASSYFVGKAHAIDRIRRCWPLMLFAMAVGMNPAWMLGLTLVMTVELLPRAAAALRLTGLGLVAAGVGVVIDPRWAPVFFGTG